MSDWRRRADPAFYDKEPFVLRTVAQVPRYSEDAQAEARFDVLARDPMVTAATMLVAISTCAVAIGIEPLASIWDWVRAAAFVAIALTAPFTLPWSRHAIKVECLVITGIAVAFLLARSILVAPLPTAVALVALALGAHGIRTTIRNHPQTLTWAAFSAILATCTYAFAFSSSAPKPYLYLAIAGIAIAYLSVCVLAGRVRRAELIARPEGVLSLPQSVVPLIDRSHHHAVISWLA